MNLFSRDPKERVFNNGGKVMRTIILIAIVAAAFAWPTSAGAQAPPTQPQPADAGAAPTTQAVDTQPMQAKVIKVTGRVQYALTDEAGVPGEWQQAKVGDLLPAGSRVRTRLRSKVVLAFGNDSVVMIDRATLASIDQFHRSVDTKHVRLGLGHGAIRAGVAETTLRSDMTIETPIATLSKKGTIDFGIEYEPSTGRYRVFGPREGLVSILNKLTRQSQTVRPGEFVTQAMARWIETAVFDRHVSLLDLFGQTGPERIFNALHHNTGLTFANPGGGHNVTHLRPNWPAMRPRGPFGLPQLPGYLPPLPITFGPQTIYRPEGNFGTGNGMVPNLFGNR